MGERVTIVEVGPRDGLQARQEPVATSDRIALVRHLRRAGLTRMEVGSYVSPRAVPRMADTAEVMAAARSRGRCGDMVPLAGLAAHFHDTYGMGLANVAEALRLGIRTVDAATGGLGGCPFAPGAAGNVATEDMAYLLAGDGYDCGIGMEPLLAAVAFIEREMGIRPTSRIYRALRGSPR